MSCIILPNQFPGAKFWRAHVDTTSHHILSSTSPKSQFRQSQVLNPAYGSQVATKTKCFKFLTLFSIANCSTYTFIIIQFLYSLFSFVFLPKLYMTSSSIQRNAIAFFHFILVSAIAQTRMRWGMYSKHIRSTQ